MKILAPIEKKYSETVFVAEIGRYINPDHTFWVVETSGDQRALVFKGGIQNLLYTCYVGMIYFFLSFNYFRNVQPSFFILTQVVSGQRVIGVQFTVTILHIL
jgi:hypothetical protein